MGEPRDTGDLLEVPDNEQLDTDQDGELDLHHAALVDLDHPGDDTDGLDDIYADPGEVRDLDVEPFG